LTWANIWAQADRDISESWSVRQVSLAAYQGRSIRLRMRAWANGYYGDFLIDLIGIGEEKPSAPLLSSPAYDTVTDQQRPILSVTNSVDPQGDDIAGYRFEVYSDETLTTLVAQVPVVAQGAQITSWQVDVDLPFEAQYWWRARATDIKGNVGDWMETATFLVSADNQPPAPPEPVRPIQGGKLDDLNDMLAWYPAVDPNAGDVIEQYHLQIDDDPDFSSPIVNVLDLMSPIVGAPSGSEPAIVLIVTLADLPGAAGLPIGSTLHWRLRARDRFFAWSGWSTVEPFVIRQNFAWWRESSFTAEQLADPACSGLLATPQNDGVPNLMKYAFNLDPSVAAAGAGRILTSGSGTSGLPAISYSGPDGSLRVEYLRRRNADDLVYEVQFCSDLTDDAPNGWAAATATESVVPINDEWERVIVADQPPPGARSRFGRVLVQSVP
ncbi:MAG: hypothetical protein IT577_19995, partial [Verrucomicrobiae bacterium]|nr:hypothetical protein [Verrucomicrobiae bacterium]